MSTTYVCDGCGARWKITASPDTRDEPAVCPNCAPSTVACLDGRRRGQIGATRPKCRIADERGFYQGRNP